MPDTHQTALYLPLNRTGLENKMKMFVGHDKDREIKYQLQSQTKQT